MRGYHLRTHEQSPFSFMGLSTYPLDSIYIPERQLVIGFAPTASNLRGEVLNQSQHHMRAQAIVDGNKNGVRGDIIGVLDLDPLTVDLIAQGRSDTSLIKLASEFDGSTNSTVEILCGELRKEPIYRRVLEAAFSR